METYYIILIILNTIMLFIVGLVRIDDLPRGNYNAWMIIPTTVLLMVDITTVLYHFLIH